MRKYLASAAIIAMAAATSAHAADMAVKAPMVRAPVFTWTGCYVGGHVGWGWSKPKFTDHNASSELIDYSGYGRTSSIEASGGMFGGQIGCDYQFGGNFLVGVSGSISAASISGNDVNVNDYYGGLISAKTDRLADISGRIGATMGPTLIYAKGGVAWAHSRYTQEYDGYYTQGWGTTSTGVIAGAGVEYAFMPNWTLFAEYNHYFFDSKTLTTDTGYYTGYLVDTKHDFDTVKVGVNWRFNSMSAPITARY